MSLDRFLSLPIPFVTPDAAANKQIISRAFEMVQLLQRSYYDAIFVAFAESLGVPLLTADGPLAQAANSLVDVTYLGEFV